MGLTPVLSPLAEQGGGLPGPHETHRTAKSVCPVFRNPQLNSTFTHALPQVPKPRLPSSPLHLQLFLAFNATAHSLVANSLSRRAEGRAAEVLARLAQLAVALSIPVAVALFVGRGLLPDLFTGVVGECRGWHSLFEHTEGQGPPLHIAAVWQLKAACCSTGWSCRLCHTRNYPPPTCLLRGIHASVQRTCWCATRLRTCCPCCCSSW